MDTKLYYGIDLGTTNSAIAYGHVGSNGKVNVQICKVNRRGREGGMESKETLPSAVYYKSNMRNGDVTVFVGDFAKNQYGKKYGHVMKSVKSCMGETDPLPLKDTIEDKTPQQVSARILKHLVLGLKEKMNFDNAPENVIITIPASFDTDQCRATLEAAEIAGLKVKDANGNYLTNTLLYEPKAVIYNVANLVANGDIPTATVDFSKEKNVLVFDLGGGTLDVALYKVKNNDKYDFPVIDEVAVGRYTRIGGDDFDRLLGERLVKEFLDYNSCSESDVEIDELRQTMESKAEYMKYELSDKVWNANVVGNSISDDEEIELSEMDLYKGMEFEVYLTKKEIEDILSPLMGNHLTENDVKRIDKLTSEKDINNIIYPILDVLAKAEETEKDIKIDTVILNGGMTKFYLIKDRIEKFFGIKPVCVSDPDLAVAKGAAFYQYCLDKAGVIAEDEVSIENTKERAKVIGTGIRQLGSTIVNDNINLGLVNGYIKTLVKAGTKLPTGDIEIDETFRIPVETQRIELPIFIGRGQSANLPNKKISSRVIEFNKPYPAGTPVTLVVSIDRNKMMTLKAYVGEDKKNEIEVTLDTGNIKLKNEKSNKLSLDGVEKVNAAAEMEVLRVNAELFNNKKSKKGKNKNDNRKPKFDDARFKIQQTLENIRKCSNKKDFQKLLLDRMPKCDNWEHLKGVLIDVGVIIYDSMDDEGKNKFKTICRQMVTMEAMRNTNSKNNIEKAIIALGKVDDKEIMRRFEELIGQNIDRHFKADLVHTLGNMSVDNELLTRNFLELDNQNVDMTSYAYAVGKTLSRKYSEKNDETVEKIVKKLMEIVKLDNDDRHVALVSLGEICNTLPDVKSALREKVTEKVGQSLSKHLNSLYDDSFKDKVRLVINVVFGLDLNEEEEKAWNSLTEKK